MGDYAQEKAAVDVLQSGRLGGIPNTAYRRPSLTDELEKAQYQATEESEKRTKALNFFRANPAFDEFIQLIRSGSIHI